MSYSIEQLDLPIPAILARVTAPFDPRDDVRQMVVLLDGVLRRIKGDHVNLIVDMSTCDLTLRDLVIVLTSLNEIRAEVSAINLFHPRVTPLFVDPGDLVHMIVDSFRRNNLRGPKVRAFTTLEDAFAFARGQVSMTQQRSLEGMTMPCAILQKDIPAPVVHYHLDNMTVFAGNWEQMALDIVTMLAGIDGDAAYLVIETPRLDMTAAEMTAILSPTSNPHGGSEISRTFQNKPMSLTMGVHNLNVVVTGLRHGHYGAEYLRMMKVITQAMEQITQAWSIIRAIKGVYGSQLTGIGQIANREN